MIDLILIGLFISSFLGSTFFVKGKDIYKFDNKFSQVQNGWPQPYTSFWTECGQDYATFGALKQRKVHTEPSFTPVSSASIQSSEISNILTRCQLTFLIIYAGLSFYQ